MKLGLDDNMNKNDGFSQTKAMTEIEHKLLQLYDMQPSFAIQITYLALHSGS